MTRNLPVTGNTELTQPENRAFYPALDGLRAMAFLMVFCQHYLYVPWGWTGVDLFFVLSGFLITGILFDTMDDRHRARNFYVRRTLRIFPLYYGVMLLLLLTTPILHWHWSALWLVWPAYIGNYSRFFYNCQPLSLLQQVGDFQPHGMIGHSQVVLNLGHFWSLCVEEQFYLVWPWFVFWIRDRRRLIAVCVATLPLCLALRLAGQHYLPAWMLQNEVLYRVTPFRLDSLLLGGLCALWLRGPRAKSLLRAARFVQPIAVAAIVYWCLFAVFLPFIHKAFAYPTWKFTWGLTIIDLLFAALIVCAIQPGSLVYRIFRVRPLRWLGRISYGAYVIHDIPHTLYNYICAYLYSHFFPAMHGSVIHKGLAAYCTAGLALVSTCLLAWLSFRFYESLFLNLKERWTVRGG